MTKTCRECKQDLPADSQHFYWHKRGGWSTYCKPCTRARSAKWQKENPERANARKIKWAKDNPARRTEAQRRYFEKNADAIREKARQKSRTPERRRQAAAWRARNREHLREYFRQYNEQNPERVKAIQERWRRKNKDAAKVRKARRRSRERNATGKHTREHVRAIYAKQGERCFYCNTSLHGNYHLDHRIPISRGGTNDPANLVCACAKCNLRKHNKTDAEFMGVDEFCLFTLPVLAA
jgi:5-methylcytosine-specific restriction endonuclease McrA